jgi:hypothetical protein
LEEAMIFIPGSMESIYALLSYQNILLSKNCELKYVILPAGFVEVIMKDFSIETSQSLVCKIFSYLSEELTVFFFMVEI